MPVNSPAAESAVERLEPALRMAASIGALLLTLAILLGGRVPEAVEVMSRFSDKLLHATAYGMLATCWCIALGGRRRMAAVVLAVATGVLDEWLQRALPGRQPDLLDLLADAVGAIVGACAAGPAARRVRRVPSWLRIGATYFALVFGAGSLLGVLRVPLLEPIAGERLAQLLEMPLMALVIVFAARWLVRRERQPVMPGGWLAAGVTAALGVLVSDLLVGVVLRGLSLAEVLDSRDPAVSAVFVLLVAAMVPMPWIAARRSARATG